MAPTISPVPSPPITTTVRTATSSSLLFLQNGTGTTIKLRPFSSSSLPFRPLSFTPKSQSSSRRRSTRNRTVVISYASSNGSFNDFASRLIETSRRSLESSWNRTVEFFELQNIEEKMRDSFSAANQKFEELSFDARRSAEDLDRRFRASERAKEVLDFASQQAKIVDEQFGLVQKFKNVSADFQRNWPTYRRQLNEFQQTSIGQTLIGSCPSCKRPFVGARSQTVTCNYCRSVVWQPRQDFSKADSDPSIIDVDIE